MFRRHSHTAQPVQAEPSERPAVQVPRARLPVTYTLPEGDSAGTPFVVAHNDTHFCPWDAAAVFFVIYANHPGTARPPGVYVWNLTGKTWDRVAELDDLPAGEWVGVQDATGFPLPLRLCRAPNSGMITAIWTSAGGS
jgi:hypothetical protein